MEDKKRLAKTHALPRLGHDLGRPNKTHSGFQAGGRLDESTVLSPRAPAGPKASRGFKRSGKPIMMVFEGCVFDALREQ